VASEPSNLRHLFGDAPAPSIDVSSVIRRSRARRAPRVLGAGAVAVLAIGTLAYGGFAGLAGLGGTSTASDSGGAAPMMESDGGMTSMAEDSRQKGAEGLSLCGAPVAEIPPSETGLVLSVAFPTEAAVGAASIDGIVTMTNTGTQTVHGTAELSPTVTLSQDGTVIWHSHDAVIVTTMIDLGPGEALDFDASLTPVACAPQDDQPGAFRSDLPAAPAGDYRLSAAIELYGDDTTTIVSGPSADLTLR
jgi:hypothetical protein